jgi:antitoxin component YwqK of YwqJK toxin-antitoxin module
MRKIFFILPVALFICAAFVGPDGKNHFEGKRFKADFNMKQGMLNGKYVSYYSNGVKRAEGQFQNNMRAGLWSVWDSTGKLLTKREYKNGFECKILYPEVSVKGNLQPVYTLTRNGAGLYSYFNFQQKDVVVSKRIWREAMKDDESSFFGNDDLYHALVDSIVKGKISIYDPSSDELTLKISGDALKKIMDTTGKEIIGFKIKEDWFYDNRRNISEKRIISICPVVCKKNLPADNDDDFSFDMGWFYFPALRNTMNVLDLYAGNYPSTLKTVDDIFFFRYFPSTICKESNVKNQLISDYAKGSAIQLEDERIEVELIEMEHDLWVKSLK